MNHKNAKYHLRARDNKGRGLEIYAFQKIVSVSYLLKKIKLGFTDTR